MKVEILRNYYDKLLQMKPMKKGTFFVYEDAARVQELEQKGYVKVVQEDKPKKAK